MPPDNGLGTQCISSLFDLFSLLLSGCVRWREYACSVLADGLGSQSNGDH